MLLNTRGRNQGSRPKHFRRPPVVRMVYEVLLTDKSIFHCVCQNIDQKLRDWLIGNQSVFGNWRQFWTGGTTRSRRKFGSVGHQDFSSLECQVGFLCDAVWLNDHKKKKLHHYLVPALQWSIVFYGGNSEKSDARGEMMNDEKMLWSMWLSIGHDDRERERHKKQCLLDF
jgi:hypothetical protein